MTSKSELIALARRLRDRAAAEAVTRSAAARATGVVESVGARGGTRDLLLRAAARVRVSGSEGRLAAHVARFLELLAGGDSVLPPHLPLEEVLYVAHWARRLLPEESPSGRTGRGSPAPAGGNAGSRAPRRPDGGPRQGPAAPGRADSLPTGTAAGSPTGGRARPAAPAPTAMELAMQKAQERQEQERARRRGR